MNNKYVYINHQKVNMIIKEGNWKIDYLFNKNGYYYFEIVLISICQKV